MKDHKKRELINKLRDIAVQFAHTQQLRQRIAEVVLDALTEPEKEQEPYGYLWFTKYMEHRFTHRKPDENERIGEVQPVYTAPPQRPWVGLTDEDVGMVSDEFLEGVLWAEAKLKEKNG